MPEPSVLVIHAGARHNYALPAAFADRGMLAAFYTDICAGRGFGRLMDLSTPVPLPQSLDSLRKKIKGRRPPAKVLEKTRTDSFTSLRHEIGTRLRPPADVARSQAVTSHHRGQVMAQWSLADATHVFTVDGDGGQLLDDARSKGLPVFSDVIVALSTHEIAWREYEAYPAWGPPPHRPPSLSPHMAEKHRLHLQRTDIFVCPSQFVADDLIENWGVDPDKIRIIPYALSADWFKLTPAPQRERVLFVGSADRRKGIHYLAFAAEQLRERGRSYDFRIAGGVAAEVRDHHGARHLNFLGRVPRQDIAEEFIAADIFVLPTLAEGSATVVYEAMSAGLPVITTHAAGSVITDGIDGLIVPERDPDALANAIERLVEDRALRDRLGHAAREKAQGFSWDIYAKRIVDLVKATPAPKDKHHPEGGNT